MGKPNVVNKVFAVCVSLLLCCCLPFFARAAAVSVQTPGEDASLRFSIKLGTGYRNAPTPPAVRGDSVYVVSGRFLYQLSAGTGETLAKQTLESISTYTAVPPTVTEDRIYMPLDDGVVQAFDRETLTPLWTYVDPLGGQGLCPVAVDGGRLYTGFWNGETNEASFVCLPADGAGAQRVLWSYTKTGGFYRATALTVGDTVVVGSDNGERVDRPDAPGAVLCFDKTTGALRSSLSLPGDIRCGVARDPETGALWTATKAGLVVRMSLTDGVLAETGRFSACGAVSVTPVPFGGSVYFAAQNGRAGRFYAVASDTLIERRAAELPGVPQGDLLLSSALWADYGTVQIYMTYNAPPGGILMVEDSLQLTEGGAVTVFDPPEEAAQYCFCPVVCGEDGALYYKNDSGTVFAVSPPEKAPLSRSRFVSLLARLARLFTLLCALRSFTAEAAI